jgi:hypothetical protein
MISKRIFSYLLTLTIYSFIVSESRAGIVIEIDKSSYDPVNYQYVTFTISGTLNTSGATRIQNFITFGDAATFFEFSEPNLRYNIPSDDDYFGFKRFAIGSSATTPIGDAGGASTSYSVNSIGIDVSNPSFALEFGNNFRYIALLLGEGPIYTWATNTFTVSVPTNLASAIPDEGFSEVYTLLGTTQTITYRSLSILPLSVPEPSTAIAMGLLGLVGFAGNRRRRRQVSVA